MNDFDQASISHEMAAGSTVHYRSTSHLAFKQFYELIITLKAVSRTLELDEQWLRVMQVLTRFRYEASHVPLPFNHEFLWSRIDLPYLQETVRIGQYSRPTLAEKAGPAVDLLTMLSLSSDNPFEPIITDIRSQQSSSYRSALLLSEGRFTLPVGKLYEANTNFGMIDVITQDALRRPVAYDQIIAIGDTRDFEDFVFSSSRSLTLDVVGFPWQNSRWRPSSSFRGNLCDRITKREQTWSSTILGDQYFAGVDVDEISDRLATDEAELIGRPSEYDQSDARLYALYGGKGVFLEVSENSSIMILDLEADSGDRAKRATDAEIDIGMYVILRTDSREGYVGPLADAIMGKAAPNYRAIQFRWKSKLREKVTYRGIPESISLLESHGSPRANTQNLRNWMSSRTIAPRDFADFHAIMTLCGIQQEAKELFANANRIRNAHMRAGRQIQARLRSLVMEGDVDEIERQGSK